MEALLRQNCSTHSLDVVTKLCLSLEGLSDMKEIRKCRRLTHLDLSVNMIGKIDGLEACRDLQELSMKENKLLSTDGLQHASAHDGQTSAVCSQWRSSYTDAHVPEAHAAVQ